MRFEQPVTKSNPKMLRGETEADFCRRMGWGPGTFLAGNEGYGTTVIQLTAIGAESILARSTNQGLSRENSWTLQCRDWEEIHPDDEPHTNQSAQSEPS